MNFIDLNRQYDAYKEEIDAAIFQVVRSGRFVLGEKVRELEDVLAGFVGVDHAVGVSSGTDGLVLGLMAHDVGPGDEVVTTPFTFIATAEAVALVGARPVFADIDPLTYNIDPMFLEDVITQRRRAGARVRCIIPVGLYGQCADMDEINEVARKEGLFVLEDACQSFGASYRGRMSCALSHAGVTSFFPAKPLGAYGDGGMVFTSDAGLAERLRRLRVHGERSRYDHREIGLNARLDALQAAVLLTKFHHFPGEVRARQEAAEIYRELLSARAPELVPPFVKEDRTHVYAQYTIRIPKGRRERVTKAMQERGIPYAIHYPVPLHLQPAFSHLGYKPGDLPRAERAAKEVLSLPMHPFIEAAEQEAVVDAVCMGL